MSYEGREEHLCKVGHRWEVSCYESDRKCPVCGEASTWSHAIDDTNGDAIGTIPDNEWTRLLLVPERQETCNLGHSHIVEHARYRPPTQKELRSMRHCWDAAQNKYVPLTAFVHDD